MKTLHGKLPLMSQYWTNANEWDKIETQIIGQNWILILIFLIDDIQQETVKRLPPLQNANFSKYVI